MGLRLDPDPTKRIRQLWGEGSLGAEGRGRQDHAGGFSETDGAASDRRALGGGTGASPLASKEPQLETEPLLRLGGIAVEFRV